MSDTKKAPQGEKVYAALPEPSIEATQCDSTMRYTTVRAFSKQDMRAFADATSALRAPGAGAQAGAAVPATDMVSVNKDDANNYCRILTALGMEEEGDPVAEVQRLLASAPAQAVAVPADEEIIALLGDPKYSTITAVREALRRWGAAGPARDSIESVAVRDSLRALIEAIEYTPLGLRAIRAVTKARAALAAAPSQEHATQLAGQGLIDAARGLSALRAEYAQKTHNAMPGNEYWGARFAAKHQALEEALAAAPAQAQEDAPAVGDVVYRWQSMDFSGYCYGSNPPDNLPARCNLTAFYRQPDTYSAALYEISATGNLTATGKQFAQHLQQIALAALAAAPQAPAAPVELSKPAAWVNGERLLEVTNDPRKMIRQLWLKAEESEEDDTALFTAQQVREILAAPAAPAVDAREVDGTAVSDLAYALQMLVGSDALPSLCVHEPMDAFGRVKGTWSAAAQANAKATLKLHAAAIAAQQAGDA